MEHVKQNDKNCLPIIQTSGCRFRCDGLAAEYRTGKSLTAEQLNETWQWAQDTNRIGKDQPINCGVKRNEAFNPKCATKETKCPHWDDCKFNCELDGASIATRFLRQLGDKGHFTEVAIIRNGIIEWYPAISQKNRRMDVCIQKIRQGGLQGTHFRFVDKNAVLIEDPHNPAITAQGVIYTVIYAYYPV
jgi:hypothetical protein